MALMHRRRIVSVVPKISHVGEVIRVRPRVSIVCRRDTRGMCARGRMGQITARIGGGVRRADRRADIGRFYLERKRRGCWGRAQRRAAQRIAIDRRGRAATTASAQRSPEVIVGCRSSVEVMLVVLVFNWWSCVTVARCLEVRGRCCVRLHHG